MGRLGKRVNNDKRKQRYVAQVFQCKVSYPWQR